VPLMVALLLSESGTTFPWAPSKKGNRALLHGQAFRSIVNVHGASERLPAVSTGTIPLIRVGMRPLSSGWAPHPMGEIDSPSYGWVL